MIKIQIGDKTYKTLKLNELSIKTYNIIINLINSEGDDVDKIKLLLHYMANIPEDLLDMIDISSFTQINFEELLKIETHKEIIKPFYHINNTQYKLPIFDELTFGEWIDLDYFITNENHMINVLSRLLISSNINLTSIQILAGEIETEMPVIEALTIFDAFTHWRLDLIKKNDALFQSKEDEEELEEGDLPEEEEEEEKQEESTWMDIAYSLSGDDIIKVNSILDINIIEVFNWLNYQKEKNEKEIAMRKQNNS